MKLVQESEGVVQPGAAIIEIGNTRSLEVEVEVLSADAVKIAPGMRVLFERWGGDQPLEGRVRRVEPVAFTKISALGVEEQRVLAIVDITSPAEVWQRLGTGYRVEAVFILWESGQVLQVPASALFRYGQGWAVFVVDQGIARRRAVEIGRRNGPSAEVVSGLSEGDRVITHPDETVEDNKPVQLR
jgi:HlyD family secretion protein